MNMKFVVGTAAVVGALTALIVTAVIKKRKQLEFEDFEDIDFDDMDDDMDCYEDVDVDVRIPGGSIDADDGCACCSESSCDCSSSDKPEEDKK